MTGSQSEPIIEWLERAGAKKIRVRGDNAVCCCPFHKDQTPSFAMHVVTGLYVCYSASCGVTGNFARFLHDALDMPWQRALEESELLIGSSPVPGEALELPTYESRRKKAAGEIPVVKNQSKWLAAYDICPTYMLKRGFKKSTLKAWSIGYDKANKAVTIPVFDAMGGLIGFTRRDTTDTWESKYLHGSADNIRAGFDIKKILFGEHMFRSTTKAVVTEGTLDPIAAHQLLGGGQEWACLSTSGSAVSNEQKGLLKKYKTMLLVPDGDKDGFKWTHNILKSMQGDMLDRRIEVVTSYSRDYCKDMADLMKNGGAFEEVLSVPAELWVVGGRDGRPVEV
jgi:DNA primase